MHCKIVRCKNENEMYFFIQLWILFLKFLEKTCFSQVVATGRDSIKLIVILKFNSAIGLRHWFYVIISSKLQQISFRNHRIHLI